MHLAILKDLRSLDNELVFSLGDNVDYLVLFRWCLKDGLHCIERIVDLLYTHLSLLCYILHIEHG
jgi:hypothetical protein